MHPQPAETSPGMGALKWEHRPFHLPPFSLSAPLLARVLVSEWEKKKEGREHPLREADRDGTVSVVVRTREGHRPGKQCEIG